MAAPSIPNLNSPRFARAGRGRGSIARGPSRPLHEPSEAEKDEIVQRTDQDATYSRMSAVALGYMEDPFAQAFMDGEEIPKRYPIINRGTFARTTAIDLLVDKFLSCEPGQAKQIVSLGAGSDTRYYRTLAKHPSISLIYHELDFAHNTQNKIRITKNNPFLLKVITDALPSSDDLRISTSGDALYSPGYNIHPVDLRTLITSGSPLHLPNLSLTAPTLILSECCLCYLAPDLARSVLRKITAEILPPPAPLSLILYEPIRPFDPFGRVMESNLAARGIHLQTLHIYATLSAQKTRLLEAGFTAGRSAADMHFIYDHWIPASERQRVARCEMMDEVEEWQLLAQHYCITWGWRHGDQVANDPFGVAWKDVPVQANDQG